VSNAKQILAMLRSRAEGDEDAFFSIVFKWLRLKRGRDGRNRAGMRAEIDKARAKNSRGASVRLHSLIRAATLRVCWSC